MNRWKGVGLTVTLAAMSACGSVAQPSPVATPLNRVVEVDQSNLPVGVVAYGSERGNPAYGPSVDDARELEDPEDVSKLRRAPDDFKEFLAGEMISRSGFVTKDMAARVKSLESEECDFLVQFRVWGLTPDVATGRIRSCGQDSYDVIWQKKDGAWRQASRQQGGWNCSELEHYRVPAEITAAVCWSDDGRKTFAYNGPDAKK